MFHLQKREGSCWKKVGATKCPTDVRRKERYGERPSRPQLLKEISSYHRMIEKIPAESKVETGSRVIISLAKGNSPAAAGFFTHFFFRRKEPGGEPYKTPHAFP